MNFDLRILGTASAMPISDKNPSAQALQVQGRLFLIDCGEGVQQQLRRDHLSFLRIEAVFISHTHGDHMFGLFGLLSTMAMYGRTAALPVFGPASLGKSIDFYMQNFRDDKDSYAIEFHPVCSDGLQTVYESKGLRVSAFPLSHGVETYGYRFDEILTERQASKHAPRSYAYCSDTRPFPELSRYVEGVDVLYHESTYLQDMADKAAARFHSTALEAAECARRAGARKLILGHYSSRVRDYSLFEREARTVFPESYAGQDFDVIEILSQSATNE